MTMTISYYTNLKLLRCMRKMTLSLLTLLLTMVTQGAWAFNENYYISSQAEWNEFAESVSNGNNYYWDYVYLTADITVTKMAGTSDKPFQGTFNGQGHTLTLDITGTTGSAANTPGAPFCALADYATIQNLNVTGSITTNGMRAASIACFVTGDINVNIRNCKSSVAITSSRAGDIDAGGFVGRVDEDKKLFMTGCVFTGSITYSDDDGYQGGGFVGWLQNDAYVSLSHCLFAPTSLSFKKSSNDFHTFAGGKGERNLTNCYYNDVAAGESKITKKEGMRAYSINAGLGVSSVTISGEREYDDGDLIGFADEKGIQYQGVLYAAGDKSLPLTLVHADVGTLERYVVTGGGTLANPTTNTPTLTMTAANQTIIAEMTLATDGEGASLIASEEAWEVFCYNVANGNTYSGQTVKLTANLNGITTMAGKSLKPFSGTFDGQGHTLNLNMNVTTKDTYIAPFAALSGAAIKNLNVTGSITTNGKRPASIASFVTGNSTITNCKSSVALTSSYGDDVGDIDAGGFVARVDAGKHLEIYGSAFTGSITYSNENGNEGGGMVGWLQENAYLLLYNCLFAPTSVSFAKPEGYVINVFADTYTSLQQQTHSVNCFYNDVAAGNTKISPYTSDRQARSISSGSGVGNISITGSKTVYDVSGITAFERGFIFDDKLYACGNDVIILFISDPTPPPGSVFDYYTVTGGGSLANPTINTPTLTMSAANQTINAVWKDAPTHNTTFVQGNDNEGWSIDPTSQREALPVTVSYAGEHKVKNVRAIAIQPFSVSSKKKVYFSRGNLQLVGENSWKFADNQWDYFGNTQANNHRDLFGWGTGNNPNQTSTSYSAYPSFTDWGENANLQASLGEGWRTLTGGSGGEWYYLLFQRSASTVAGVNNARFLKAKVNDVPGVIILPDKYTHPDGVAAFQDINSSAYNGFNDNVYNIDDWEKMESAGCVFLPITGGYRWGNQVESGSYAGYEGYYWSSTPESSEEAYEFHFNWATIYPALDDYYRNMGLSVRLVHDVENSSTSASVPMSVTPVDATHYTFNMTTCEVEVSTELWYKVNEEKTLAENIAAYGTKSDFFVNRTLTANVWNTFASPFAIAAADMDKYFGTGAKVRQLSTTEVAGNVLTLSFTDASAIVAGQPYLVKPAANIDFSADGKEFADVDLTAATATPTTTDYVNFIPTLGKTAVDGDVNNILILNTSGTLVHPSVVGNMKGFRGYFLMHDAPAGAREFIMNFGEGETTGIQPIRMENGTIPAEGTYDLSGRRIQGQPKQKGIYIQNGKKVAIK